MLNFIYSNKVVQSILSKIYFVFSQLWLQGLLLTAFFFIFVVLPNTKPDDLGTDIEFLRGYWNEMHYYVLHINSFAFITLSALILFLSINQDVRKANETHIGKKGGVNEAEKTLDDFFEDKIDLKAIEVKSQKNDSLRSILMNLKHGGIEEDLILGIDKIHLSISTAYEKLKNDYEYLATVMPIIGMIGTIAGLLIMFAEPGQAEDFDKKFAGLSLALSTTLYASLYTVVFFKPLSRRVDIWQSDLDQDFQMLEIATRKFYHKVNMAEIQELILLNGYHSIDADEAEVDVEKEI